MATSKLIIDKDALSCGGGQGIAGQLNDNVWPTGSVLFDDPIFPNMGGL